MTQGLSGDSGSVAACLPVSGAALISRETPALHSLVIQPGKHVVSDFLPTRLSYDDMRSPRELLEVGD